MNGFKTFSARPTSEHLPYEPINVPDVQNASVEQQGAQNAKTAAEPHPGSARPQMGLEHPEGIKTNANYLDATKHSNSDPIEKRMDKPWKSQCFTYKIWRA